MTEKEETKNITNGGNGGGTHGNNGMFVSTAELSRMENELLPLLNTMTEEWQTISLTNSDRLKMLGSGVRRYGFIDKVSDLALTNPEFIPPFLNIEELKERIREIEGLRDISVTLQQMQRINDDILLVTGNDAFRLALMYYNTVREASRRNIPGALALFKALELFFRRPRHTKDEPTDHEVERDVHALLHGHKDGEIIIKNESPHTSGGEHVVVDSVHSGHTAVKETEKTVIND